MSVAFRADDFDSSHSKRVVYVGIDSAFIALIERRPSASAVEFGFRRVQRISAPGAHEVAFRWVEFIVFSGSCRFVPLVSRLDIVERSVRFPLASDFVIFRTMAVTFTDADFVLLIDLSALVLCE